MEVKPSLHALFRRTIYFYIYSGNLACDKQGKEVLFHQLFSLIGSSNEK